MGVEELIRALPKAELHVHVEGTLEPEMMFDLAARNGVALRFASVEEVRAAYAFTDLQSFLDIYYEGMAVLLTERDFHDLARAYFQRAHTDGVRHAELFFDPQAHTGRAVPFETVVNGLHAAIEEARAEFGISALLILCFLRHLPAEQAMATLEEALPFLDRIAAVGLDSSEAGHPPADFVEVYARARAEGLRAVAHAGEEGPPEYVRQALDLLGVERIDHGVRSEEDPALLERLVREGVPLTMCPLSNVKLRVVDRLEDHNLKRLLDAGVRVLINSDDPAYFGGYIGQNYVETAEALALTRDEVVTIARNSLEATFLDDAAKAELLAEIDEVAARLV
ncbi:MAG: adenosine deaminase [Chloroflexi bacterium]|nr:adenosine deaminase [Chloroflexota bacterium]MYD64901.1 adenosine deaminase [Chloroflexota bacterium]